MLYGRDISAWESLILVDVDVQECDCEVRDDKFGLEHCNAVNNSPKIIFCILSLLRETILLRNSILQEERYLVANY